MKRYVIKPRLYWSEDLGEEIPEVHHAKTVYEPDDEPRPTGILDARGNELYSVIDRQPIGFARLKEH